MKILDIGTEVIVGEPKIDDLWEHSFTGSILKIVDNSYYMVEDQDGNCFCVDFDQVTISK